MKLHKYIGGVLAIGLALGSASCSEDFLDENLETSYNTQYFDTPEGLEALTLSLYGNIRWHFGYEWAFGLTLYGADEFDVANDYTNETWNTYDNRFSPLHATTALGAANANCTAPGALWDQLYFGIASCNTILEKADAVFSDPERNSRAKAHAYFLRGYNEYRLAAQYGTYVIVTEPVSGVVRNFTRATQEEAWGQCISDLRNAYEHFSGENFTYGKGMTWTKATAAHFLAKALLFRASERNSAWNASYIDKDLEEAIKMCDYVIGARSLESDYSNLYANWTDIDCAIETSDEILMAATHNGDTSTAGRFGNRTYNYFNPQFSNFSGGWVKRGVWIGGMDFQRCRPTEYTYSVFDHKNDARMWKTFRTVYGANSIADASAGVALGDPGIIFILNTKDDHTYDNQTFGAASSNARSHSSFRDVNGRLAEWAADKRQTPTAGTLAGKKGADGQYVPNAWICYQNGKYVGNNLGVPGGTTYNTTGNNNNMFCGINKTDDGSRLAEKGDAHRDVTMARVGETYLVRAECYVRQHNYSKAMEDINVIRRRAQWKNGENRSYYVDGSQAFEKNSLYEKNKEMYINSNLNMNTYYLSNPDMDVTTAASDLQLKTFPANLPAEDEAVMQQLGVSGDYDRAINFILNERTRELLGEWQRWETLSRTGWLIKRAKAFNAQAALYIKEGKHELRPIPQSFIDGLLQENGDNLTSDQKAAWQNPGY